MKKQLLWLGIIIVMSSTLWITYSTKPQPSINNTPSTITKVDDDGLKVAIISDAHIMAKDPNKKSTDDINLDIMNALKEDLLQNNIHFLILCGDNTNSSQPWQHVAVRKKLNEFINSGIEVILIPGNHDIDSLKEEEFADFYQDFGYEKALSLDATTLSYSYLKDDYLFLMLDTDGYTDYRYATLSTSTLHWMEEQLQNAKDNQWQVITIGHYPMVTDHVTQFIGEDQAMALFKKYQMPLYICGHLHHRNVSLGNDLVELVVDKLTSYPCHYASLSLSSQTIIYQPKSLDISKYHLQDYALLQEEAALAMGDNIVDILCKDYPEITKQQKTDASNYFTKMMAYLSEGTIYRHLDELKQHPGASIFEKIAEHSNYGPWLPVLFFTANPYTEGFTIINGQLQK